MLVKPGEQRGDRHSLFDQTPDQVAGLIQPVILTRPQVEQDAALLKVPVDDLWVFGDRGVGMKHGSVVRCLIDPQRAGLPFFPKRHLECGNPRGQRKRRQYGERYDLRPHAAPARSSQQS